GTQAQRGELRLVRQGGFVSRRRAGLCRGVVRCGAVWRWLAQTCSREPGAGWLPEGESGGGVNMAADGGFDLHILQGMARIGRVWRGMAGVGAHGPVKARMVEFSVRIACPPCY